MRIDDQQLRNIVERASTLADRLGSAFERSGQHESGLTADDRYAAWRTSVAQGDDAQFMRRLAWDGLDPPRARAAMGAVRLRDGQPLPNWAFTLRELLAAYEAAGDDAAGSNTSIDPAPFDDLLRPLAAAARARLASRLTGEQSRMLGHTAWTDLEGALLRNLCTVCAQPLYLEFCAFRVASVACGAEVSGYGDGTGCSAYEAFTAAFRGGGHARFFAQYPVLGRMVATVAEYWVANTAELVGRLARDRTSLEGLFFAGASLPVVDGVEADLSDPHRSGHSVCVLTFAPGRRLVYKPRGLAPDQAFGRVLEWLNDRDSGPSLRVLCVLDRGTHGYVEYAAVQPCPDEAAVTRYYERAGALLAAAYLLGASDLHSENLRACGEDPVLVDLEVLAGSPVNRMISDESSLITTDVSAGFWNTVLRTMLLPRTPTRPDDTDPAGFGGDGPPPRATRRRWTHANTDLMGIRDVEVPAAALSNVPHVGGEARWAGRHVKAIVHGFARAYRTFMAHREELAQAGGLMAALEPLTVRVVLRSTRVYAGVLARLLHPRFLQSGADRSIAIDNLARPLLEGGEEPAYWAAYRAECADLEQFDVPLFLVRGCGTEVHTCHGAPVAQLQAGRGYDLTLARLAGLCEGDLDVQVRLIRTSLEGERVRRARRAGDSVPKSEPRDAPDVPSQPLTAARASEEAEAVADALRCCAVARADGVRWVGLFGGRSGPGARYSDVTLHEGTAGIALFLAAVYATLGNAAARALALRATTSLVERLGTGTACAALAREVGIGGVDGVGGVAYALARIGSLIDAPACVASARALLAAVGPEAITTDRKFDVFGGAAGTLLAALAVYEATGDEGMLALARRCGSHLTLHQTPFGTGTGAWRTGSGEMTTGFAHGASGIAHALLMLCRHTGSSECRSAAAAAHAFERMAFMPDRNNWRERPLTRGEAGAVERPWCTWCHGASGIGLARAGGWNLIAGPDAAHDLDAAVAAAVNHTPRSVDHLCCGNLGRADFLLTAGEALGRPDLRTAAWQTAGTVVARAAKTGAYLVGTDPILAPGFFQGMAGIGYELLRLHHPSTLPSVLLLA